MYQDILEFWFDEVDESKWWSKDDDFDKEIIERFSDVHARAVKCELYEWRECPEGRLAEILVLDQFSRNMYRNSPLSFYNDSMALSLAQQAISLGEDKKLNLPKRSFLYLPFMHSESETIHNVALELFRSTGIESSIEFEIKHKEIIDRFGRYPHRNDILGRRSTEKEIEFLKLPGAGF